MEERKRQKHPENSQKSTREIPSNKIPNKWKTSRARNQLGETKTKLRYKTTRQRQTHGNYAKTNLPDPEIANKVKTDLRCAVIGGGFKYGLSLLRIEERDDRKLQQFPTKCLKQ